MQDGFEAVSDFLATHTPANALVVAGDVDPDAVVAQAEATLGSSRRRLLVLRCLQGAGSAPGRRWRGIAAR